MPSGYRRGLQTNLVNILCVGGAPAASVVCPEAWDPQFDLCNSNTCLAHSARGAECASTPAKRCSKLSGPSGSGKPPLSRVLFNLF